MLRPAYDASAGVDGRVSIEVDPRLAHDTEQTIAEAKALWWLVDRPNLFIKIPATEAGLPAITATLAEGISVNVTLIFSLDRYDEVMDAFLAGLEQAKANGHDLSPRSARSRRSSSPGSTPRSTSGWTSSAARRRRRCAGKAAIANARLAYERVRAVFGSERWQALAAAGAHPQRPLWASTGVKDPDYHDTMLRRGAGRARHGQHHAGGHPPRVRRPRRDPRRHDHRPRTTRRSRCIDELAALGIDYDDVVQTLEDEGVEKFEDSLERADRAGHVVAGRRRRRRRAGRLDQARRLRAGRRRSAGDRPMTRDARRPRGPLLEAVP